MTIGEHCLNQVDDSVLLLIDVQEKLVAAMTQQVQGVIVERINILMTAATKLSVPVMVTEQYPKGLGNTVKQLAEQFTDEVVVVEKTQFSAASVAEFTQSLEPLDKKQVVIVGMEAHICVLQTALALQGMGFQVFVVEDGVSARSEENKSNALQRLRDAGVIITNVESVIFEWLENANHTQFKTLAKLIV